MNDYEPDRFERIKMIILTIVLIILLLGMAVVFIALLPALL